MDIFLFHGLPVRPICSKGLGFSGKGETSTGFLHINLKAKMMGHNVYKIIPGYWHPEIPDILGIITSR